MTLQHFLGAGLRPSPAQRADWTLAVGVAAVLAFPLAMPSSANAATLCDAGSQENSSEAGGCSANASFGGDVATNVGLRIPPSSTAPPQYFDIYLALSQTSSAGPGTGHAFAAATVEFDSAEGGEPTGDVTSEYYTTASATGSSYDTMTLTPAHYGENVTVKFITKLSASVSMADTTSKFGYGDTSDFDAAACVAVGGDVCAAEAISDAANPAKDALVGSQEFTFYPNPEGKAIVPFVDQVAADVNDWAGIDLDGDFIQENDGVANASDTANFYIQVLTPDVTVTFASGHNYAPPAIPEPSTWAMMLFGFAGLGFAGWRASRKTGFGALGMRRSGFGFCGPVGTVRNRRMLSRCWSAKSFREVRAPWAV